MFKLLIVLISVDAVLLCTIVLLQSAKGGGLAATFGGASSSTDSFIGGRQAANLLTKLTWIGGGLFLFLSLVLSVLSSRSGGRPSSILRGEFGGAQVPVNPTSVLEGEAAAADSMLAPGAPAPATDGKAPTQSTEGSESGRNGSSGGTSR